MGMFDYMECAKRTFEGTDLSEHKGWQTKDVECLLNYYRIEADGKFVQVAHHDTEHPEYKEIEFTGDILFYGGEKDDETIATEFVARVVGGECLAVMTLENFNALRIAGNDVLDIPESGLTRGPFIKKFMGAEE